MLTLIYTLSPIFVLTSVRACEPAGCTLSDGTNVPDGWHGAGRGWNHCNSCNCGNGILSCTRMGCLRRREGEEVTSLPPPPQIIKRRLDGRNYTLTFDDMRVHDPLCEWILNDGLDSEWTMLSEENKPKEADLLLSECDEIFKTPETIAQCKFYVYAIGRHYTSEVLLRTLKFDPVYEDSISEYQKCGKVTVGLNDAVEDGEISGVKIVEMDGEDYFVLEDPIPVDETNEVAVFSQTNEVALSAAVSVGSMISAFIGATMVKVCRDFNPVDYSWVL